MKTIDVSEWNMFSERLYSKSYSSQDGTLMLKAVSEDDELSVKYIKEEYEIGVIANRLGVPTPKVYDLVKTSNNEIGIIYDYITDKVSCSRGIFREPERIEEYVKVFATTVKKFHSTEADTAVLPSYISKIHDGLNNTQIFTDEEKELLKKRLAELPTDTKCLHGDMQLSNVIHSPVGDFVIDLGLLSYGNPLFDVGFFYYLTEFLPADLVPQILRIDMPTFKKCWELYAKEYFESDNLEEIEERIKPYAKFAGLPVLVIDGNMPSVIAAKDFILSE